MRWFLIPIRSTIEAPPSSPLTQPAVNERLQSRRDGRHGERKGARHGSARPKIKLAPQPALGDPQGLAEVAAIQAAPIGVPKVAFEVREVAVQCGAQGVAPDPSPAFFLNSSSA